VKVITLKILFNRKIIVKSKSEHLVVTVSSALK